MESTIGEFFTKVVDPCELPDFMSSTMADLNSKVTKLVQDAYKLADTPEIPATRIVYSLKTIGDKAKKIYHQEKCTGGPLYLLNKAGNGWVRKS